jgi:hypothetical protein
MISKAKGNQTAITGYYDPDAAQRLKALSETTRVPQSVYLREALDDLLKKYAAALRKCRQIADNSRSIWGRNFMERSATTKLTTWQLCTIALAVLLPLCLPPWWLSYGSTTLRLGIGTPFGPTIKSVAATAPACTNELRAEQARYAQNRADWERYPADRQGYQQSMRSRDATIRELVARGIDPSKVTMDGRPMRFSNGMPVEPSAQSEPLPPSEPSPSMADAASNLAAAHTKCDDQAGYRLKEARIDFATLAYNLVVALLIACLVIAAAHRFARRIEM